MSSHGIMEACGHSISSYLVPRSVLGCEATNFQLPHVGALSLNSAGWLQRCVYGWEAGPLDLEG